MKRRLSLSRLAIAIGMLLAGAAAIVASAHEMTASPAAPKQPLWYAPYVDVTNTPEFQFQDAVANPSDDVVLGFVVAGSKDACVPTWGTYFGLASAAQSLDLDRRIARLRGRGGDLVVSFGGAANDELAVRCSEPQLVKAYGQVINRYGLDTIDIDVEGAALSDTAANERRAAALKTLQSKALAAGKSLSVWLTVPVAPSGMPAPAVDLVRETLAGGVTLSGVNVLTMDYGPGVTNMVAATSNALEATERQLASVYAHAGVSLSAADVWHRIGMTPMIGQNDVTGEQVSVGNAKQLADLAQKLGLGRVSMWSLNRDAACGAQIGVGIVSTVCSGVPQAILAFTNVFDQLPRRLATASAPMLPPGLLGVSSSEHDNPATSPDPIWTPTGIYEAGAKVTWHHNVFQAKWYTQDDLPDAPVTHEWDTPWLFLGPVLPGDKPSAIPKLAPGVYPAWSPRLTYIAGDRIEVNGVAYDAKWWTHGDPPQAEVADPDNSPWAPVEQAPA